MLNPEAGGQHIFAGQLNRSNFVSPPPAGGETPWAERLRERLDRCCPMARWPTSVGPSRRPCATACRWRVAASPTGVLWLNLSDWTPARPASIEEAGTVWLKALDQALGGHDPALLARLARDAEGRALEAVEVRARLAAHFRPPEFLHYPSACRDNIAGLFPNGRRE